MLRFLPSLFLVSLLPLLLRQAHAYGSGAPDCELHPPNTSSHESTSGWDAAGYGLEVAAAAEGNGAVLTVYGPPGAALAGVSILASAGQLSSADPRFQVQCEGTQITHTSQWRKALPWTFQWTADANTQQQEVTFSFTLAQQKQSWTIMPKVVYAVPAPVPLEVLAAPTLVAVEAPAEPVAVAVPLAVAAPPAPADAPPADVSVEPVAMEARAATVDAPAEEPVLVAAPAPLTAAAVPPEAAPLMAASPQQPAPPTARPFSLFNLGGAGGATRAPATTRAANGAPSPFLNLLGANGANTRAPPATTPTPAQAASGLGGLFGGWIRNANTPTTTTTPAPLDCARVQCPMYKCREGYTLQKPNDSSCCPVCTPPAQAPPVDCAAVRCAMPGCGVGYLLHTPEGACCPTCVPDTTTVGVPPVIPPAAPCYTQSIIDRRRLSAALSAGMALWSKSVDKQPYAFTFTDAGAADSLDVRCLSQPRRVVVDAAGKVVSVAAAGAPVAATAAELADDVPVAETADGAGSDACTFAADKQETVSSLFSKISSANGQALKVCVAFDAALGFPNSVLVVHAQASIQLDLHVLVADIEIGVQVLKPKCPSMCPMLYAPLCGSDGTTYSNACQLTAHNCRNDASVTVAHEGECVGVCPAGCTLWSDGCNDCQCVGEGVLGGCTRRACFSAGTPMCLEPPADTPLTTIEPPITTALPTTVADVTTITDATTPADTTTVADTNTDTAVCPPGCVTWFDGCNSCSCSGTGQIGACTLMACLAPNPGTPTPAAKCSAYTRDAFPSPVPVDMCAGVACIMPACAQGLVLHKNPGDCCATCVTPQEAAVPPTPPTPPTHPVVGMCAFNCPQVIQQVCGTDNVTYDNQCLLARATCNDPTVAFKNTGPCGAVTTPAPVVATLPAQPPVPATHVPTPGCCYTVHYAPGTMQPTYGMSHDVADESNCIVADRPNFSTKFAKGVTCARFFSTQVTGASSTTPRPVATTGAVGGGVAVGGVCPARCISWFDGCNSCSCVGVGRIGACTKMACPTMRDVPQCMAFTAA